MPFGLFYDTVADCTFDLGRELDNYHGFYRYFVADYGDLDYYFMAGATVADVVRRYTWLTGRPALTPKWSLGYSGSTMTYTDAPNAQERMNEFLLGCEKHDILCDSFHLSSGYTSIGEKRYVFNWNRTKFPDPPRIRSNGIWMPVSDCVPILNRACCAITRALMRQRRTDFLSETRMASRPWCNFGMNWGPISISPIRARWSGGRAGVSESLLKQGVAATWNDNNEFEIWSTKARIHGFGETRRAVEAKTLQTLLMMRASWEAQREFAPDKTTLSNHSIRYGRYAPICTDLVGR